jgi:guanine nucleotide-binding protein G(i) subunit alpha
VLEERKQFKQHIYNNLLQIMKKLLEQAGHHRLQISPDNTAFVTFIMRTGTLQDDENLSALTKGLKLLWKDEAIQETFKRSGELDLPTATHYFYDSLDRLFSNDYIPTLLDILNVRIKTTGVVEAQYCINNVNYSFIDVGGQRSERKKWIHQFEVVDAVIFVAACSEYDQFLVEDDTVSRMKESLDVFNSIVNSKSFINTAIILLLNKVDVFKEKIKICALEKYFEDYDGKDDFESAKEFISAKYLTLNKQPTRRIYTHYTTAIDTENMNFIIHSIIDMMVRNKLKDLL